MRTEAFQEYSEKVVSSCAKAIVGKDEAIQLVLTCFVCSGHVLLEDVPGTGKTMLLRAFAKSIGGGFKRVQFTPDLLPSDLTGINFFSAKQSDFIFRPGPLFSNIVLADEINRATPRTQSSLLEAMEERQITIDGETRKLPEPFMVMATQNPLESYGTFPLPEAQIDRFLMRLSLGYMTREQELSVLSRGATIDIIEGLRPVVTPEETAYVKASFPEVTVSKAVAGYIMDLVSATRREQSFAAGVSTRGAIALYRAAQVWAAFAGRDFVTPEDIKALAPHTLTHRVLSGGMRSEDADKYMEELLAKTPAPTEAI